MKKVFLLLLVLLIGKANLAFGTDLLDVYRDGAVRLAPDAEFGNETDWEELLYYNAQYLAVAPDGCVFMTNGRECKIRKFTPDGKLIKSFGQKGLGPGDMIGPSYSTILDNRYLVVNENLIYRRVSIFDLNGNFIKLIKTDYSVFKCCALKDNKIALLTRIEIPGEKQREYTAKIYVFDIKTGVEKLIFVRKLDVVKVTEKRGVKTYYSEEVFMHSTKEGNILMGFNNSPEILIFSPSGKKVHSFNLKINRQKITSELKLRMYNVRVKLALENRVMPKKYREGFQKGLIKDKNKILSEYPDYFAYYDDLFIDSDNNILLLKNRYIDEPDWNWTPVYQVYSVLGDLKCEFTLDIGDFDYTMHFQKLFFNGYLYGIFEKETDDDDVIYTLEKMTLKPKTTKTEK